MIERLAHDACHLYQKKAGNGRIKSVPRRPSGGIKMDQHGHTEQHGKRNDMLWECRCIFLREILQRIDDDICLFFGALKLLVHTLRQKQAGENEEKLNAHCSVGEERKLNSVLKRKTSQQHLAHVEKQNRQTKDKPHEFKRAVALFG